MIVNKAYKVELKPNNKQRSAMARSAGCARFAYNWGLAQRINIYEKEKKSTTAINQHKDLCAIKEEQFPWMYESSKCAPQEALRDLDKAFKNFFRGVKSGKKTGFPKFKSKHRSKSSFRISTGAIYVNKSTIKLPMIPGKLRLKEKGYVPTEGVKYNSFIVSEEAGRWFLSVQCVVGLPEPGPRPVRVVGVDLGIKTLAVTSDGVTYSNPKSYKKLERTLSRAQRERCRRVKGSSNRRKSIQRLQDINYRIRNVRKDNLHKMTSDLVRTKPSLIVLEDLSVNNMLKNRKLAGALSDASFGEIRRQVEYKAAWYGSEVAFAGKFFPSSKLCSACGALKEDLTLSDRVYKCECGNIIDRDLNAALNLKRYGEFHRSLSKQKACGEERSQFPAAIASGDGALPRSRNSTANLPRVGRFV
jgi:putative transposase